MARKQTKRQKAALKGWATRRARTKAARIKTSREIMASAFPLPNAMVARLGFSLPVSTLRRLVRGWFP